MKRHDAPVIYILLFMGFLIVALMIGFAKAEDETEEGWILCQPDSFVNIRNKPNKNSEVSGYLMAGDRVFLDGKQKKGYLHCVGLSNESGEGWVAKGFICLNEPHPDGHEYRIKSSGRVAARCYIGGNRRRWLRDGYILKVYMVSEDWSLTTQGFVRTEFIDLTMPMDIQGMDPEGMTWEE